MVTILLFVCRLTRISNQLIQAEIIIRYSNEEKDIFIIDDVINFTLLWALGSGSCQMKNSERSLYHSPDSSTEKLRNFRASFLRDCLLIWKFTSVLCFKNTNMHPRVSLKLGSLVNIRVQL